MKYFFILFLLFFFFTGKTSAQRIRGIIKDANNDPIVGAVVVVKGTNNGTTSDIDGKFELKVSQPLPYTLSVSFIGFLGQEINVTDTIKAITVRLKSKELELKKVEVTGSRVSEKQKQSPLTVESIDRIAIKECAQTTFYESLGTLKGVDLTSASLGFTIINTRGFNSTSPVRSLQIIDGVDNQAPGLNFSLGNFLGSSELDVLKVDLIAGASSAFYGPNAFNGVISMTSRSPFFNPGLEVQLKGGEHGLVENAIRWSQVIKNKKGEDKFGYKMNIYYMKANDWEANNLDSTHQSLNDKSNPGGYDAVNIYGDEYNGIGDYSKSPSIRPGLGIFYRTGYAEKDLVDYHTRNIKIGAAFHFKVKPETEIIFASNFGTGTTIYQGDNRYSLKDIKYFQNRIELVKKDKYFIRAYATNEDAGKSYDAFFTALLLQQAAKTDVQWYSDYSAYWAGTYNNNVRNLPGFPQPPSPPYTSQQYSSYLNSINSFLLSNYYDTLVNYHKGAEAFANSVGNPTYLAKPFFEPGTARYDSAFNAITSRYSYSEGGSRFYDKSALYHIHGEYTFNLPSMDITTGANFRTYIPDSRGTIFSDTGSVRIKNKEYGLYAGGEKSVLQNKLKLNLTVRMDKNDNFDYLFSSAASGVYTFNTNQIFRLSFSSAIRNPTLIDQYIYYNVGRATLVGNIHGFDSLVTIPSLLTALVYSRDSLKYFNISPLAPEKVKTIEVGYRGILFRNLYVDAGYYYSFYKDFIGYKIGSKVRVTPISLIVDSIYRVSANSPDKVTTQGFSVAINYYIGKYFTINANYSWNKLDRHGSTDPIIPAYNTPEHKYNLGISGRNIDTYFSLFNKIWKKLPSIKISHYGFAINYKWVKGFIFEGSPQFTGYVPTYDLVDVQINKHVPEISCTFKLGASNVLNKLNYQVYGGPNVGRLAYFSILYEMTNKGDKKR